MLESPTLTFSQDEVMNSSLTARKPYFSLSPSLKHFASANRPLRRDALLMQFLGADRIPQRYRIVDNLHDSDIRFTADFEAADSILPADNAGCVDRALRNNLVEAQTHRQELGQHRR